MDGFDRLIEKMEEHQAERREMYNRDVKRITDGDEKSRRGVNSLVHWVVVRSIIEIAILVVLIVKL